MAKKKKPATDLLEEPMISEEPEPFIEPETPFDKSFGVLTATGGKYLELMTRTTPKLAQAINVGYNMIYNFKSMYLQGRIDTLMRIHVSLEGKGRSEMVQALQAGSGVPDSFFDQGNGTQQSFVDIGDEFAEE